MKLDKLTTRRLQAMIDCNESIIEQLINYPPEPIDWQQLLQDWEQVDDSFERDQTPIDLEEMIKDHEEVISRCKSELGRRGKLT